MSQWVKVCGLGDAPKPGQVIEAEELNAVDNWCPHRRGPLGQGWLEGNAVVCPWHSWTFNLKTGIAEEPVRDRVDVFPLRIEGDDVLVDLE